MSQTTATTFQPPRFPGVVQELLREQLPVFVVLVALGYAAAYWQHGITPANDISFPLANVRVPVWHLIWAGVWTGYTMAIVGEAAGIFILPYQMSILLFNNAHVTPTTQLVTCLNPPGALFGFVRNKQANWDFAKWVCAGGICGAMIGPFIRLTVLKDAKPFTFAVGIAMAMAGFHLCYGAFISKYRKTGIEAKFRAEVERQRANGQVLTGLPPGLHIETVSDRDGLLTIEFWGERWIMRHRTLFLVGFGVAIFASALGVGGGFLLVPFFAAVYRLPMYVLVAASIPYVIVLSAASILTYTFVTPLFTGSALYAEFAWGLFASAGGVFGAWAAAKTQRFVPAHLLKLMLGAITAIAGTLYVIDFLVGLPFRI